MIEWRKLGFEEEYENERVIIYPPIHSLLLVFLMMFGMLFFLAIFFWWSTAFIALFRVLGFSLGESFILALTMIFLSAIFSLVNIPVLRVVREIEVPTIRYVYFFGIPYTIPVFVRRKRKMIIAVNLGGAVIPLILSAIFIAKIATSPYSARVLISLLEVTLIVTFISYVIAKPVRGVGIVMPGFIPPLISAFFSAALTVPHAYAVLVAYSSATIGVLLGADILHLIKDWDKLQAPIVSIGGAGTFDGIYLSGIMSVIFLPLFLM